MQSCSKSVKFKLAEEEAGRAGDKENSQPDGARSNKLNNSNDGCDSKVVVALTNKNVLRSPAKSIENVADDKNARRMSSPSPAVAPAGGKHIRFNLPDLTMSPDSLNETLTPPPKEFKRADYKTLRAARCMSTVVTEKEKAILVSAVSTQADLVRSEERLSVVGMSPRPPAGIVRSMCRFYQDNFRGSGGKGTNRLNRSSSFSNARSNVAKEESASAPLAVVVDHGQASNCSSSSSDGDASSSSCRSSEKASPASEEGGGGGGGRGSFRLFRSRSWSLRRKRETKEQAAGNTVRQPKRCSPSYSTKSQDSGFSDSDSNRGGGGGKLNKKRSQVAAPPPPPPPPPCEEEEEDPNLTQMPPGADDEAPSLSQKTTQTEEEDGGGGRKEMTYRYSRQPTQQQQLRWMMRQQQQQHVNLQDSDAVCTKRHTLPPSSAGCASSSSPPSSLSTPAARNRVESSIGNIASMQEGLKLKTRLCEEEEEEESCNRKSLSASNLLKAGPRDGDDNKASKQFYFADVKRYQERLRQQQREGAFEFRKKRHVVVESNPDASRISELEIGEGGAPAFSTPVRASFRRRHLLLPRPRTMIEAARTPVKADSGLRRPREVKREDGDRRCRSGDFSSYEPDLRERSELPSNIEQSMVAVWSQFLDYEATLPELSSVGAMTTPDGVGGGMDRSYNSVVRQLLLSGDASRRARAAGQREVLREAPAVANHDEENDLTRLSHLPSYAVDGTETQLLVESFNNRSSRKDGNNGPVFACADQSTLLSQSPPGFGGGNISAGTAGKSDSLTTASTPSSSSSSSSAASHHVSNVAAGPSESILNTSPVDEWWRDLHAWCEPECMTYLQSKPINSNAGQQSAGSGSASQQRSASAEQVEEDGSSSLDAAAMVEGLQRLQRGARAVHVTLNALNNHFSAGNLLQIGRCLQTLISQVQEFIFEYNANSHGSKTASEASDDLALMRLPGLKSRRKKRRGGREEEDEGRRNAAEIMLLQQRAVLQVVDRLKLCAHRCQYTPQQPLAEMKRILAALEAAFNRLGDLMLASEMASLVAALERPRGPAALRAALNTLILLGNEGSTHLCALLAREGAVRATVRHCSQQVQQQVFLAEVRVLALRALSSVCCVAECIREFEQCGGLVMLDSLLTGRSSSVEDRVESAGVLAQITSPWIADNHRLADLDSHVPSMVSALTGLARLNNGEETFLLVTAALANLTFMSPLTNAALKQCNTLRTLVRAVRAAPFTTLFAKDQVVTVLANMAASPSCRPDLRAVDGVSFLIDMLDCAGNNNGDNGGDGAPDHAVSQAEVAAAERVQKKAAIALSRLCSDTQVCFDVIRLGGADRLVDLCKNPAERNYSDAVLVACLAVLRRLKNNLDNDEISLVFDQLDASDLVRPKLVDSFLEYSAKQESYV